MTPSSRASGTIPRISRSLPPSLSFSPSRQFPTPVPAPKSKRLELTAHRPRIRTKRFSHSLRPLSIDRKFVEGPTQDPATLLSATNPKAESNGSRLLRFAFRRRAASTSRTDRLISGDVPHSSFIRRGGPLDSARAAILNRRWANVWRAADVCVIHPHPPTAIGMARTKSGRTHVSFRNHSTRSSQSQNRLLKWSIRKFCGSAFIIHDHFV